MGKTIKENRRWTKNSGPGPRSPLLLTLGGQSPVVSEGDGALKRSEKPIIDNPQNEHLGRETIPLAGNSSAANVHAGVYSWSPAHTALGGLVRKPVPRCFDPQKYPHSTVPDRRTRKNCEQKYQLFISTRTSGQTVLLPLALLGDCTHSLR